MTKEDLKALAEAVVAASSADITFRARVVAAECLRLLAHEEARGEVVAACPRCSAHHPEWLPDAGCWVCNNCMVHLDIVDYWQRVNTAPTGQD